MPMLKIKFSYLSIEKNRYFHHGYSNEIYLHGDFQQTSGKTGKLFCKLVSNIQICFPSYLLLKEEDKENPGVYDFHSYTADKICSGSVMSQNKLIFEKSIIQYSSNPSKSKRNCKRSKFSPN